MLSPKYEIFIYLFTALDDFIRDPDESKYGFNYLSKKKRNEK